MIFVTSNYAANEPKTESSGLKNAKIFKFFGE